MGITSLLGKLTCSKPLHSTTTELGKQSPKEVNFFTSSTMEYFNFRSPLKLKTQECVKVHCFKKKGENLKKWGY